MSTHHHRSRSILGKARVEALSDGVFAVAMTILVLNLQSPVFYQMIVGIQVQQDFRAFLPQFMVYVLSFVIVGIYWVAHHNTFHFIKHSDRNLLWLNIFLLICIVFIPFATALLGLYPGYHTSVLIYGGTLIVTGVALQLLWLYATKSHRLVDKDIDPNLVRRATRRNMQAPCIYMVAVLVSFLSIPLSLIIFALVPIIYIFPSHVDHHWSYEHHLQEENKMEQKVSEEQGESAVAVEPVESQVQEASSPPRKYRKRQIPGKTFYERQIALLEQRDARSLLAQYHPEASIVSFDFVVEGHEAIHQHFERYLEQLGVFRLLSTEKFVETSDAIFFEATVETAHGVARVYNIFLLHGDKATHHFTGILASEPG